MNKKIKKLLWILLLILIIALAGVGIRISINNGKKVIQSSSINNAQSSKSNSDDNKNDVTKTENSNQNPDSKKYDIVMPDTYFITQLNEIYYNMDDYAGKTIQIEGFPMSADGSTFVGRYGPGCCSNDAYAYIEYKYSEELDLVDEKDWIRVTGTIKEYDEDGAKYVCIEADNVEKLNYRGKDTVTF